MRRFLALFGFILGLIVPVGAQDAASILLPRINNLRASKGLPRVCAARRLEPGRRQPCAVAGGQRRL